MVNEISPECYEELGVLLQNFYREYKESKSETENEFILTIERTVSFSSDKDLDLCESYHFDGRYGVGSPFYKRIFVGKKFFDEINESGMALIVKKVSEYTSEIRTVSMIFLPQILDSLRITQPVLTYGIQLSFVLACLIVEKFRSNKKDEEISRLKELNEKAIPRLEEKLSQLHALLSNPEELKDFKQLTNKLDNFANDLFKDLHDKNNSHETIN